MAETITTDTQTRPKHTTPQPSRIPSVFQRSGSELRRAHFDSSEQRIAEEERSDGNVF